MATGNIPRQRLSRSQKTKTWAKGVIDDIEGLVSSDYYNGRSSRYKKQVNYDLQNGIMHREDYEYVLNPFGLKEQEFPASLQHYDIISPKINLLVGEEIKRPFNFRVVTKNNESISKLEDKRKELIIQALAAEFEGATEKYGLPETPEEIEKYLKYSYQDIREIAGNEALEYLLYEQRLQEKFNRGFKDALIAGEEIYYVGVVGGEPVVRNVNPIDISVVMDPDSEHIEDAQAIVEERWMTPASILDEYFASLKDNDIAKIEEWGRINGSQGDDSTTNYPVSNIIIRGQEAFNKDTAFSRTHDSDGSIRVVRTEWKSMRKVGFLETTDELGDTEMEVVDEMYPVPDYATKTKDENGITMYHFDDMTLTWHWISEYWEGTKIGDDIYLDVQAKANQRRSMDNPSVCKSGYIGFLYNSRNSEAVSLIERMKAYQYLYNIIYYRLELALAKSKGKIFLMDVAQIPSSEGWDVDKWMYYLESMGIGFINSMEEGKHGNTSQFNQFQAIDLEMGSYINQHVMMLQQIEDKLGELAGVSRQRQGQITSSETVGTTERAVVQSSHITEIWFYYHNIVKQRVLEGLMDVAKLAWKDGKKINYIASDMSRIFFSVDGEEFDDSEFGVFVTDSSRDIKDLEDLKHLAQAALQSGSASLSDIAGIIQSNSIAQVKKFIEQSEETRMQMQQQATQQQQQHEQAIAQQESADKEADRLAKENQNIRDNDTKVQVALINQAGNAEGGEESSDDDHLKAQKLAQDAKKNSDQLGLQKDSLAETKRKNDRDYEIATKKLAIDKKKAAQTPSTSKSSK